MATGCTGLFGFEGEYNSLIASDYYQSGKGKYWGATNPKTGKISYGDLAFEDYSVLKATYYKEILHSNKIMNGLPIKQLPRIFKVWEWIIFGRNRWLYVCF